MDHAQYFFIRQPIIATWKFPVSLINIEYCQSKNIYNIFIEEFCGFLSVIGFGKFYPYLPFGRPHSGMVKVKVVPYTFVRRGVPI